MIKRILAIMIVMLSVIVSFGQSLSDADVLFKKGEYGKAKVLYFKYREIDKIAANRYNECINLETLYKIAENLYNEGKFNKSISVCEKILIKNSVCAKTKKLIQNCNDGLDALRKERADMFEYARVNMSVEEFEKFKDKYKMQKEWVEKANSHISDIALYKEAINGNTRDSYVKYLSNSTIKAYEKEANFQIGRIDSNTRWNEIKGTRDLTAYELYLKTFAVYNTHNKEAEDYVEFLQGIKAAEAQNWTMAYRKLGNVLNSTNVNFTKKDKELYNVAKQECEYASLPNAEKPLIAFMNKYPKGVKYKEASGRVARLKANELKWNSSRNERLNAMSYAINGIDKQYVQVILDRTLAEKRRHYREAYGPKVTFGMVFNGGLSTAYTGAFGMGFNLRLGRYTQFLNGTIGTRYEMFNSTHSSPEDYRSGAEKPSIYILGQQVIIPIGMRFNLIKLKDKKASIYAGSSVDFHFTFADSNMDLPISNSNYVELGKVLKKKYMSIVPSVGIHSHHWDFNVYYRIYDESPFVTEDENPNVLLLNQINDKMISTKGDFGITFGYYF